MEITAKEAAKRLGVSHRRVLALCQNGRIRARMIGGIYLIRLKDGGVRVKPRKRGSGGPRATWENDPAGDTW